MLLGGLFGRGLVLRVKREGERERGLVDERREGGERGRGVLTGYVVHCVLGEEKRGPSERSTRQQFDQNLSSTPTLT